MSLIRLNLIYIFKSMIIGMFFFIILNFLMRDLSLKIINLIFSSIDDEKFFITLLISLIGSIFLIFGVFTRCQKFLNFKDKSKIYRVDI